MAIQGNAYIQMKVDLSQTSALDLGTASLPLDKVYKNVLTNGTGNNQANQVFTDQRTLTASSTEDIDLSGSLSDAFGNTITFTAVKAILISSLSTNTNNVLVGGASSNQFINWVADSSDIITIPPGGMFMLTAPLGGFGVTAGTGDLLKIANSGGGSSVVYDVVLIGTV